MNRLQVVSIRIVKNSIFDYTQDTMIPLLGITCIVGLLAFQRYRVRTQVDIENRIRNAIRNSAYFGPDVDEFLRSTIMKFEKMQDFDLATLHENNLATFMNIFFHTKHFYYNAELLRKLLKFRRANLQHGILEEQANSFFRGMGALSLMPKLSYEWTETGNGGEVDDYDNVFLQDIQAHRDANSQGELERVFRTYITDQYESHRAFIGVYRIKDSRIYFVSIVFTGTNPDLKVMVCTDAAMWFSPLSTHYGNIQCHAGVVKMYNCIKPKIMQVICEHTRGAMNIEIKLAGHSLGGMLAQAFAMNCYSEEGSLPSPVSRVVIFTSSCPAMFGSEPTLHENCEVYNLYHTQDPLIRLARLRFYALGLDIPFGSKSALFPSIKYHYREIYDWLERLNIEEIDQHKFLPTRTP